MGQKKKKLLKLLRQGIEAFVQTVTLGTEGGGDKGFCREASD